MNKKVLTLAIMASMLFIGCNPKGSIENSNQTPQQATMTPRVDNNNVKNSSTIVVLETSQGNIELKMLPKVAPLAVENFVTHVKEGYYNGLIFHRVIKDFMIQGGDPTGTGRGGESIWKKEFVNEYAPNVVFDKPFLLAMANHGPNTNGSQFFITTKSTPFLNGAYTIFGEVVSGKESVVKIENTKTGRADRPISDQKIIKAYVK